MWVGVLFLLLYAVLVLLITGVVAALLLALGTALTFLFAVSVWEATLVTVVVAAGVVWLLNLGGPYDFADEPPGEPIEDDEQPRIYITDLPTRLRRGKKRRRR